MEAMLAMNLLSMGTNALNNVVGSCASALNSASSSATSSTSSFDNILKTEQTCATSKYATMDATALTGESASLQKSLSSCDDVKNFIGSGKSFKVRLSGDGYEIERADGKIWQIPNDSKAAGIAKDYCDCSLAQSRLNGNPVTGMRSTWTVKVES
jgi:hypothetical protein